MDLSELIAGMRAMGIKSLSLELESPVGLTYTDPDRPTDVPPEPKRDIDKPPHLCAEHGCLNVKGGALGQAPELCQDHALIAMGVRA